jgi:hypothetical protein
MVEVEGWVRLRIKVMVRVLFMVGICFRHAYGLNFA